MRWLFNPQNFILCPPAYMYPMLKVAKQVEKSSAPKILELGIYRDLNSKEKETIVKA